MRRLRFRTKIFLALGAITCASLALVLVLLQEFTVRRVHASAQERFERTLAAFRRLEALRARFLTDEIESLAGEQSAVPHRSSRPPRWRRPISASAAPSRRARRCATRTCACSRWRPRWRSSPKSDVVLVANAAGELLYSKAEPAPLRRRPRRAPAAAQHRGHRRRARRCCCAGERTASGALLAPERPAARAVPRARPADPVRRRAARRRARRTGARRAGARGPARDLGRRARAARARRAGGDDAVSRGAGRAREPPRRARLRTAESASGRWPASASSRAARR